MVSSFNPHFGWVFLGSKKGTTAHGSHPANTPPPGAPAQGPHTGWPASHAGDSEATAGAGGEMIKGWDDRANKNGGLSKKRLRV